MCSGLHGEQDPAIMGPSAALLIGRKRGIYFDVDHGGGSFKWFVAALLIRPAFSPTLSRPTSVSQA